MWTKSRLCVSIAIVVLFLISILAASGTVEAVATATCAFNKDSYNQGELMVISYSGSGGLGYDACFIFYLQNPSGATVYSEEYWSSYFTDGYSYSANAAGTWTAKVTYQIVGGREATKAKDTAVVSSNLQPDIVAQSIWTVPSPAVSGQQSTVNYKITTNSAPFTQTITTKLFINGALADTKTLAGSSGSQEITYSYPAYLSFGAQLMMMTDTTNAVVETVETNNQLTTTAIVVPTGTVSIPTGTFSYPGTISVLVGGSAGDGTGTEGKFVFKLKDSSNNVKKTQEWTSTAFSSWQDYSLLQTDPGGLWTAELTWYRFASGISYSLAFDRTFVATTTPILSPSGSVSIPGSSYAYPGTISVYIEGWHGDGTDGKFVYALKDSLGAVKKSQEWASSSPDWAFGAWVDYVLLQTDKGGTWTGELVWYRFATGISYRLSSDTTLVAEPYSGTVTLTYPANAKVGVPVNPTLTWTVPAAGANYYRIYVNPGTGALTYYSNVPSLTIPLSHSTKYWWQVQASPDSGNAWGPLTSTWYFTTWVPPTTDWFTSKGVVRGQVFDRDVASTGYLVPLASIPVAIHYGYFTSGGQGGAQLVYTTVTVKTNNKGYFYLSRVKDFWPTPFDVYAGWGEPDGYWTEKRVVSLPNVGQFYGIAKDIPGYVYPHQSFNHLSDMQEVSTCQFGYASAEVVRQTTSVLPGEPIGYVWSLEDSSGIEYGSGPGWASLVARIPYMFTLVISQDPANSPFGTPTVLDYFPVGSPTGGRDWNDYLVDPITSIAEIPADAWANDVEITDPIGGNGGYIDIWDTRVKTDGWTHGFHVPIPYIMYEIQVCEYEKTSGTETTLHAHIVNTDDVSHQYLIWKDGTILHVFLYA